MKVIPTELDGVFIIEPKVFQDSRGSFCVTYSEKEFTEKVGEINFVQDNQSVSRRGVIRGLHYQLPPFAQTKLVRATAGRVLDVAVDIRQGSPTFGRHIAVELSGENNRQLFIPEGFAHGFAALSDNAVLQYKCDNYYSPTHEGGIAFDDPELNIDWGIPAGEAVVSDKDRRNPLLRDAKLFAYNPVKR